MKKLVVSLSVMILFAAALLGVASLIPTSTATLLSTLPADVRSAAPYGDGLLLAAGEAGLYRLDADGAIAPVYKVTGQHVIDVAVGADAVYVLAFSPSNHRNVLQVVDPAHGAVTRSISLGGSVVDLAGVLADGQIVIVEGGQVRFMDPETNRTLHRVAVSGGLLSSGHLDGERLYASRGYAGGLAIIDTRTAELLEVIEITDWLARAVVAGRRAYVTSSLEGPGVIDLDTQEYHRVDVIHFFARPAGDGYALLSDVIYRLDEHGRPVQRTKLPDKLSDAVKAAGHAKILDVADAQIVVACGPKLFELVPVWSTSAPDELPAAQPRSRGSSGQ